MNTQEITTRTDVEISGIKIRGYKTKEDWFLSIRSLAELLDLNPSVPFTFLKSKWLKSRLDKTYEPFKFTTDQNREIVAISVEVAGLFIIYRTLKGDENALNLNIALAQQSLELRLEASLPSVAPEVKEAVDTVTTKYTEVQVERERQKRLDIQHTFQLWCQAKRLNPAFVHDYITESIIGRKAKDSRLLPLYSGSNELVGLDHYQEDENEQMKLVTLVKKELPIKFYRKKKDYNYKNYVDDVIQEITV